MNVAIIDYGMGNLMSVVNAFQALGCIPHCAKVPQDIAAADRIVLPGVGAFSEGMKNLKAGGWVEALYEEVINKKKPFLGICLGMQLLATKGAEYEICDGLGWVKGEVVSMKNNNAQCRVPHIGWNDVLFLNKGGLYSGLLSPQSFYFVHSYIFIPDNRNVVSGVCNYGSEFVASIETSNIFATQFHPEKSHRIGLGLLKRFLEVEQIGYAKE